MNRSILLSIAAAVFAVAVAMTAILRVAAISPEELSRRCAESKPQWQRYQEDIKAIGAGPVAAWRGEPTSARATPEEVTVTFQLDPPWNAYEASIPVLLRTPSGEVFQHEHAAQEGNLRIYAFACKDHSADAPLPWIEIHYPHTERRLVLDAHGLWNAPSAT